MVKIIKRRKLVKKVKLNNEKNWKKAFFFFKIVEKSKNTFKFYN